MTSHTVKFDKFNHKELTFSLASIDIYRDRERGVPRYCTYLRSLKLSPPRSFAELTKDSTVLTHLRSVYESIEQVDLQVGLLLEPRPAGFAFPFSSFVLFSLMVSSKHLPNSFSSRSAAI